MCVNADLPSATSSLPLFLVPSQPLSVAAVNGGHVRDGGGAESKLKKDTKISESSMWSRSGHFRKLSDRAFELVDSDGSGYVDKKELYSGLLVIHLTLATYMGPAACRVSAEVVPCKLMLESLSRYPSVWQGEGGFTIG